MTAAGFHKKTIHQRHTLGQQLALLRMKKQVSLETAEQATKVRARYLEAMEHDAWDDLPASHRKGFVRRYADFLGLSLATLEHDVTYLSLSDASSKAMFVPHTVERESRWAVTPKAVMLVCSIVVFISFIGYVSYQIKQFASPPTLEITAPREESVVTVEAFTVEGQSEPGALIYIDNLQTTASTSGTFAYPIILRPGLNQITIRAENRIKKQTTRIVSVLYTQQLEVPSQVTQAPVRENEPSLASR